LPSFQLIDCIKRKTDHTTGKHQWCNSGQNIEGPVIVKGKDNDTAYIIEGQLDTFEYPAAFNADVWGRSTLETFDKPDVCGRRSGLAQSVLF
jgi:hypothetical protein